jgi:hypothetical protein
VDQNPKGSLCAKRVRYASDRDRIAAPQHLTLGANNDRMHCSNRRLYSITWSASAGSLGTSRPKGSKFGEMP